MTTNRESEIADKMAFQGKQVFEKNKIKLETLFEWKRFHRFMKCF